MEVNKESRGLHRSLNGKEQIIDELVEWIKSKELSVRQARDLLEDTAGLIDDAWRTEAYNTKL